MFEDTGKGGSSRGLDKEREEEIVNCTEPVRVKQTKPYSKIVSSTPISFKFYLNITASERLPFRNLKYPSYSHLNIPCNYIFFLALCL